MWKPIAAWRPVVAGLAVLIAGCGAPAEVVTPDTHPANPAAAVAPFEPRPATLQLTPVPDDPGAGAAGTPATPVAPAHHHHGDPPPPTPPPPPAAPVHYTCPMHPEVHASAPGRCELCGMKLVPETQPGDAK